MNEDLQKQLAEMLAKLMAVASDGAQWAGMQIPPLVQEKIVIGRVEETAWMIALTVWLVIAIRYGVRLFAWAAKLLEEDDDAVPAFLLPVVVIASGVIPWFIELHSFAIVWFAPRLYIVEWLRTLIK